MKASAVLSLASVALAAPAADIIQKRQMTMTATDLTKGSGCKDVTFIWVRVCFFFDSILNHHDTNKR